MSNLARYTALHSLVNEMDVESENPSPEAYNDDQKVLSVIGGSMMMAGMTLVEAASTPQSQAEMVAAIIAANHAAKATASVLEAVKPVLLRANGDEEDGAPSVDSIIQGMNEASLYIGERNMSEVLAVTDIPEEFQEEEEQQEGE